MSGKNISRDVLNTVNRKTGKNIKPSDIQRLASNVKPSTVQSEAQLRQLIKNVARMANVSVTEATIKDIIKAVKGSGVSPGQLEQMMKMMMKK